MPSELARLGSGLIIQRAVEEEFDTWLGRARYERKPRGAGPGKRNGSRPRRPADRRRVSCGSRSRRPGGGDAVRLEAVPEVALQAAASNGPAEGAGDRRVRRGLSMRESSRVEEAGLGRRRSRRSRRSARSCTSGSKRSVAALYASTWSCCSSTRSTSRPPQRPKEGVICAWGITENGARELVRCGWGGAGQAGLARARPRPHQPRTRRATADRRLRRGRAPGRSRRSRRG